MIYCLAFQVQIYHGETFLGNDSHLHLFRSEDDLHLWLSEISQHLEVMYMAENLRIVPFALLATRNGNERYGVYSAITTMRNETENVGLMLEADGYDVRASWERDAGGRFRCLPSVLILFDTEPAEQSNWQQEGF